MSNRYIVGLMSGTSLDGVDAALVRFDGDKPSLLAYVETPMPAALKQRILDACSLSKSNAALLCSLNVELGELFARAALAACEAGGVSACELDCVASHGQTIYHIPVDEGDLVASTLQLGEPAVIAYRTGARVVSSFRAMDMAAGGHGAPRVPYADWLLFTADHSRALQNIGGIGNVTLLPANGGPQEVLAFDTGPGNMIIDALTRRLFAKPYDDGGALAAGGEVRADILTDWMALPFLKQPPPKATGRELYGEQFVQAALDRYPDTRPEDWLTTATRYTAATIGKSYRDFVFPIAKPEEVLMSGGGSYNSTLKRMLREELPGIQLKTMEDIGFHSAAKEAIAFAILGDATLRGLPGNLPGATGASRTVVLGSITPAPL